MSKKIVRLLVLVLSLVPSTGWSDDDGDGVANGEDNCKSLVNDQYDADLDGYGNLCDSDFNNDGAVDLADMSVMNSRTDCASTDPCWDIVAETVDMNGDGVVDTEDGLLWGGLGPSGLACAGTTPCVAAPALPALPTVQVSEAVPYDGVLDQVDIDAALAACAPGCNLQFLAATYEDVAMSVGAFPDGFAMRGFGKGVTTLRSPLFDSSNWANLIDVDATAPDGLVIEDMSLDGRKREQIWAPIFSQAVKAIAVKVGDSGAPETIYDGIVRDLEIRDFVWQGIQLWFTDGWTIENNELSGMGCHQVDTPCGDLLSPNPWDTAPDDQQNNPGRKTRGEGIGMNFGTVNATVRDNTVDHATKTGIYSHAADGGLTCSDWRIPKDILIEGNVISYSHNGIKIIGGCSHTIIGNTVEYSVATGTGPTANVANGFTCALRGDDSVWSGNISRNNRRAGYSISCPGKNLTFTDNQSIDNCQVVATYDLQLDGQPDSQGNWPMQGITITNHVSNSPLCSGALYLGRMRDASVSGGSFLGGTVYGATVALASNVELANLTLTSSSPPGADTAVFFDYRIPAPPPEGVPELDPGVPALSGVYVQPHVTATGFDNLAGFNQGHGVDDGDDVAYCSLETTPPAGCDADDTDGDGVPDIVDNCPEDANPGQEDGDSDGIGNACDLPCDDGVDNDGDTYVDYPSDPGCLYPSSAREDPQCNDGLDNDGDGDVDLADPACIDAWREIEDPACQNGIDDDGDTLIDYPADPECSTAANTSELAGGCGLLGVESLPILGWALAWRRRRASRGRGRQGLMG